MEIDPAAMQDASGLVSETSNSAVPSSIADPTPAKSISRTSAATKKTASKKSTTRRKKTGLP
jgi:hypothetical protein